MKFDRKRLLTIATCEQAQVGQKGWFGDDAGTLRNKTLNENPEELKYINDSSDLYPFGNENDCYAYFYPEAYEMRQIAWAKENDVMEGDKVRVARKAVDYEDGWDNTWEKGMDKAIGKVYEVVKIKDGEGIMLSNRCFLYPYFVLEKVKTSFSPFNEAELYQLVGKIVVEKSTGKRSAIAQAFNNAVSRGWVFNIEARDLLEHYTFDDGTPCGKEDKE